MCYCLMGQILMLFNNSQEIQDGMEPMWAVLIAANLCPNAYVNFRTPA